MKKYSNYGAFQRLNGVEPLKRFSFVALNSLSKTTLITLSILTIIIAGSGLFFYFYRSSENENYQLLKVSSLEVFDNGNGTVTLLGEISNPNKTIGAEKFSYTFNLYGQTDKKIFAKTGKSFIYPAKTRTVIETDIAVPSDQTLRGEILIGEIIWSPAEKFSYVPEKKIIISDTTLKGKAGKLIIDGVLTNNNSQKVSNISLKVILLGNDSSKQGASVAFVGEIDPSQSKNFSIEVPLNKKAMPAVDTSKTKLIIEVMR